MEALRQQLIAGEDSLGFDPGRNPDDLAVLREMLGDGRVNRAAVNSSRNCSSGPVKPQASSRHR